MNSETNYLEFKNYLSLKDIKEFINLKYTNTKASYLCKILKKHLLINNNVLYVLTEDMIYEKVHLEPQSFIKINIKFLFEKSLSELNESELRLFQLDFPKEYVLFKKPSLTKDYIEDIISQLTNDKVQFNVNKPSEIHFKNGYMDLETLQFHDRFIGKHFITKYIRREYLNPKQESIKFINDKIINLIFPVEEEKDYIMCNEIGAGLSGKSVEDQTNFFMLGLASSGKSLLMKGVKACIECYMIELKNDTFNKGNSKQDKIFNSFLINNLIRIAWVNEMDDKRLDDSLFKSFCEGVLQTVSLFVDGLNDFTHTAKLIGTMNSIPNVKIDGGVERRVEAHNPRSEFTDDVSKVDKSKNIYLKDRTLLATLTNSDELLNAFFKILAEYAHIYITDKKRFKKPKSFIEAESEIIQSNDIVGNFLKNYFELTEDENDQITSDNMHQIFKEKNPNSFIKSSQLVSELKQRKVNYNPNLRFEGGRGKFLKIKQKVESSPFDNGINYDFGKSDENKALKDENEKLKKDIEELKKQLELLKNPKPIESVKEEIKPKKKTISLEELEAKSKPKIKKNKSKSKPNDTLDMDDGYNTDDLELEFSGMIKNLKKI